MYTNVTSVKYIYVKHVSYMMGLRVYAHSGVSEEGKSIVRTFQFSGALQAVVVVPDFQVVTPGVCGRGGV